MFLSQETNKTLLPSHATQQPSGGRASVFQSRSGLIERNLARSRSADEALRFVPTSSFVETIHGRSSSLSSCGGSFTATTSTTNKTNEAWTIESPNGTTKVLPKKTMHITKTPSKGKSMNRTICCFVTRRRKGTLCLFVMIILAAVWSSLFLVVLPYHWFLLPPEPMVDSSFFSKTKSMTCHDRQTPYLSRVQKDLKPFQENGGIGAELLDQAYEVYDGEKGDAIRLHIRDNHFYISFPNEEAKKNALVERNGRITKKMVSAYRWINMVGLLQSYSCWVKFPDTDLVLALLDGHPDDHFLPIFMFQKRRTQVGILVPYYSHYPHETVPIIKDSSASFPWSKKHNMMFWRGATTGGDYTAENWDSFPRIKLVRRCQKKDMQQDCDANLYSLVQATDEAKKHILAAVGGLKGRVSIPNHFRYKYLLSLDGNGPCSGRFEKFLFGNSVIFKTLSEHLEFYYDALEPNKHYVPIQPDMTDLKERLDYAKNHDDEMKRIMENTRSFAHNHLDFGSIACYTQHLLEEYTKLLRFQPKPLSELNHVKLLYPSYPHGGVECKNPVYACNQTSMGRLNHGVYVADDTWNNAPWCSKWPASNMMFT